MVQICPLCHLALKFLDRWLWKPTLPTFSLFFITLVGLGLCTLTLVSSYLLVPNLMRVRTPVPVHSALAAVFLINVAPIRRKLMWLYQICLNFRGSRRLVVLTNFEISSLRCGASRIYRITSKSLGSYSSPMIGFRVKVSTWTSEAGTRLRLWTSNLTYASDRFSGWHYMEIFKTPPDKCPSLYELDF